MVRLQSVRVCYGWRGICVDSVRRLDSKTNRTADSIRDSIRAKKANSQVPSFNARIINEFTYQNTTDRSFSVVEIAHIHTHTARWCLPADIGTELTRLQTQS